MKTEKPIMLPQEFLAFRTANGLTDKTAAKLIGVTFQAVRMWENGQRPIPETTVRLVRLFVKFPQLIYEF